MARLNVLTLDEWRVRLAQANRCLAEMASLLTLALRFEWDADNNACENLSLIYPIDLGENAIFQQSMYYAYCRLIRYFEHNLISAGAPGDGVFRYRYDIFPGRPAKYLEATITSLGDPLRTRVTAEHGEPFAGIVDNDQVDFDYMATVGNGGDGEHHVYHLQQIKRVNDNSFELVDGYGNLLDCNIKYTNAYVRITLVNGL